MSLGVSAYLIWGVLPLYIHPLTGKVPALLILSHRVTWSVVLLVGLLTLLKGWPKVVTAFRTPRTMAMLALSTALLFVNWFMFTWLVTHNQTLQGSLGYFLNPLLSAALGMVFLKERLRPLQYTSFGIAAVGVIVLSVGLGVVPKAALIVATSFALYALIRKLAPVDAVAGLFVETAFLVPLAVVHLLYAAGTHAEGGNPSVGLLLYLALGCGVLTSVPLIFFSRAAKLLPLSTLGLLQYLAPTCQFMCAVLVFGETFTRAHAIAFPLIWVAVALFVYDTLRRKPATAPAQDVAAGSSMTGAGQGSSSPLAAESAGALTSRNVPVEEAM